MIGSDAMFLEFLDKQARLQQFQIGRASAAVKLGRGGPGIDPGSVPLLIRPSSRRGACC
jgi:hypothetical protein